MDLQPRLQGSLAPIALSVCFLAPLFPPSFLISPLESGLSKIPAPQSDSFLAITSKQSTENGGTSLFYLLPPSLLTASLSVAGKLPPPPTGFSLCFQLAFCSTFTKY